MAALAISDTPEGERVLALSGRLDATALKELWDRVRSAVADAATRPVIVDASGVEYCDGAGAALLVDLLRQPRKPPVQIRNLRPPYDALLRLFDPQVLEHDLDPEPPRQRVLEEIGRAAAGLGATPRCRSRSSARPARARVRVHAPAHDPLEGRLAHRRARGRRRLPIVALISFLLGMILAFQSAVPMKRFGAEIFVADLIGLAMLRELGPLMTAILLAGRSGAGVRRGDRHDEGQPGGRRADDDGPRPGALPGDARIIAALLMTPLLTSCSSTSSACSAARSRC